LGVRGAGRLGSRSRGVSAPCAWICSLRRAGPRQQGSSRGASGVGGGLVDDREASGPAKRGFQDAQAFTRGGRGRQPPTRRSPASTTLPPRPSGALPLAPRTRGASAAPPGAGTGTPAGARAAGCPVGPTPSPRRRGSSPPAPPRIRRGDGCPTSLSSAVKRSPGPTAGFGASRSRASRGGTCRAPESAGATGSPRVRDPGTAATPASRRSPSRCLHPPRGRSPDPALRRWPRSLEPAPASIPRPPPRGAPAAEARLARRPASPVSAGPSGGRSAASARPRRARPERRIEPEATGALAVPSPQRSKRRARPPGEPLPKRWQPIAARSTSRGRGLWPAPTPPFPAGARAPAGPSSGPFRRPIARPPDPVHPPGSLRHPFPKHPQ
jgi:hypothetical protein